MTETELTTISRKLDQMAERLHERLDRTDERVNQTHDAVVRVESNCPHHSRRIDGVERMLAGNGQPGLVSTVASLSSKVAAIAEDVAKIEGKQQEEHGQRKATKRGLVVTIVGAILTWIVAALGFTTG
jgi:hypothetical protein